MKRENKIPMIICGTCSIVDFLIGYPKLGFMMGAAAFLYGYIDAKGKNDV